MGLSIRRLSKSYGAQPALRDVSLDLRDGLVGLLGPNGSGKTTLLRCLATAIRPDAGEISWSGLRYPDDQRSLRAQLGYLPQELDLPPHMTPLRLLRYLGGLRGLDGLADPMAALAALGLSPLAERPLGGLSAGQVRLVGIAQAMLGTPRLLLLDELTRGLDVAERTAAFRRLRGLPPGSLAVFSTHVPADVEDIADQVVVLHGGRALYVGPTAGLRRSAVGRTWEARVPAAEAGRLAERLLVSRAVTHGRETAVRIVDDRPPFPAARAAEPTLEDAYLLLCGVNSGSR